MRLPLEWLKQVSKLLIGFFGDFVIVESEVTLLVTAGQPSWQENIHLTFLGVWIPFAYNAILKWPNLNTLRTIIFAYHFLIRFPTKNGVEKIWGD